MKIRVDMVHFNPMQEAEAREDVGIGSQPLENGAVTHTEIEDKYILFVLPPDYNVYPSIEIEQGYVDGYRYRMETLRDGSKTYTQSDKTGEGRSREETEKKISHERFSVMWPQTKEQRVSKTRVLYPLVGGLTAHIDIYKGRLTGHMVVEVEFPDIDAANAFIPPSWFEDAKGKLHNVTGQKAYSNKSLAKKGWPV